MQAHLVLPAFVSGIADTLFMTGFRYSVKHFDRFPVFFRQRRWTVAGFGAMVRSWKTQTSSSFGSAVTAA